jgi:hypothetical protein
VSHDQFSDLPAWMWSVEVDGFPRLYLSPGGDEHLRALTLWRWPFFLQVMP